MQAFTHFLHRRRASLRSLLPSRVFSLTKGVDILDGALDKRTQVTGYGDHAFAINDVLVRQSVILLPKQYFLWNVREFSEMNIPSLQVFSLIVPTIEVLLIGDACSLCSAYDKSIRRMW